MESDDICAIVAISCDFRYVHWNVTAALVSALLLFSSIKKKTPAV
jgi:hypothetical protein